MTKRGRYGMAVISVSLLIIIAAGSLLPNLFMGSDEPTSADAIVALAGGGYTTPRLKKAVELLRSGYAPRLIVSGLEYDPQHPAFDAEAWKFLQLNTKTNEVIVDGRSRITRDTAHVVANLAAAHHWSNIIAVTSRFHYLRTRLLFSHAGKDQTSIRVCGVDDVDLATWRVNPRARRFLRNEIWFTLTFLLFHTAWGVITFVLAVIWVVTIRYRRRLIP